MRVAKFAPLPSTGRTKRRSSSCDWSSPQGSHHSSNPVAPSAASQCKVLLVTVKVTQCTLSKLLGRTDQATCLVKVSLISMERSPLYPEGFQGFVARTCRCLQCFFYLHQQVCLSHQWLQINKGSFNQHGCNDVKSVCGEREGRGEGESERVSERGDVDRDADLFWRQERWR